jgi:hypothetical protein
MKQQFQIGDIVLTPEGFGRIINESKIGEYMINIPGKGLVYLYPEDLEPLTAGSRADNTAQGEDTDDRETSPISE